MVKPKSKSPTLDDTATLARELSKLIAANERLQGELARHLTSKRAWDEERALLKAMINQVPDYLFVKDRGGRYVLANTAVAMDLGRSDPDDLIGKSDFELHSFELAQHFFTDDRQVMQSGQPKLDIEEFMVDVSGAKKWLSTSKVPLRNERNEITGLIGVARDVTRRKQAEDQVNFLAFHDMLTGLPNRVLFEDRLDQALAGLRRGSKRVALLYVDLDRFKNVNDTLGHSAGDELIRQVAARLTALVRESDTVARLGGDEFAVIQQGVANGRDTETLSKCILQEIGRPFDLFGNPAFVGASIGIAISSGRAAVSHEMLRRADIALYRAKSLGRGCFRVFTEDMAHAVTQRQRIEQDLRSALQTGTELRLVYQPVFAANAETVMGAESLLRWDHPIRGTLLPELFVEIAEERGLIESLGEWVLREACRFAAGTGLPWIAVNVSPTQYRNKRFADLVTGVLDEMHLSAERLQIEITEDAPLGNSEASEANFKALQANGIKLTLDGFGTGYSSMQELRRCNIGKLKIDRSIVRQLGASQDCETIVRAVAGLARGMQMKLAAEGVETVVQRDLMAAIGCDELQGPLFSEPIDAEAIKAIAPMPEADMAPSLAELKGCGKRGSHEGRDRDGIAGPVRPLR
ncbi:MAG: putative bifunctional diguanylate cyclase/phosphodiesterase [Hyphomicrobiales bacterium]